MFKFYSWLASSYNVTVKNIFPVSEHSYNQCDRNFGCYGKIKKRLENVFTVNGYIEMFMSCRKNPSPFNVIEGVNLVKDWNSVLETFTSRRVPYAKKRKFSLQKYVRLNYLSDGLIEIFQKFSKKEK